MQCDPMDIGRTKMPEYVANLEDVKEAFIWDEAVPSGISREDRAIAFDRLIRQIQDEAFEDGYNQRGWETEEF